MGAFEHVVVKVLLRLFGSNCLKNGPSSLKLHTVERNELENINIMHMSTFVPRVSVCRALLLQFFFTKVRLPSNVKNED